MRVSFVRKLAMASVFTLGVGAIAQSGAMAGVTDAMLRAVPGAEWLT